MTGGGSAGREVLGGIGMHGDSAPGAQANRQAEVLPGPPARLAVAQLEQQLQQQEKAAKQARKEAKKVMIVCFAVKRMCRLPAVSAVFPQTFLGLMVCLYG